MWYGTGSTKVDFVDTNLAEHDAILDELKEQLTRTWQRIKARADAKRLEVQFTEGDLVYLKMRTYRQRFLAMWR